jgi:UDP-3-O-[3-hydroxymyristoyl] glucosamine N-acyltransferase
MSRDGTKVISLGEIARAFGGELIGAPELHITRVATLETADVNSIGFLANERYLPQLQVTKAGAVIVGLAHRDVTTLPRIVCANPYAYFAKVSTLLNGPRKPKPGKHPMAHVDTTAKLGEDVEIGPFVVVEAGASIGDRGIIGSGCHVGRNARVGSDTHLFPNVTILDSCEIGSRVILHPGVVIGADGFGIAMDEGRWLKVPQIGRVIIGDDVEIGANTTVDRGAVDDTVIEDGVKLDNQIQIGHNVRIGAHTAIAACVGIAGSSRIGRYCRIGGASGISGHLSIADHVEISAHTLITKSIVEPGTYTGAYPFEVNRSWRRNAAGLRHLDDLVKRVTAMEKKIAGLKKEKS